MNKSLLARMAMAYAFVCFLTLLWSVGAVFTDYNPALIAEETLNDDDLVEKYFHLGLTAVEFLSFLTNVHHFMLSLRQLKRILRARGCCRRKDPK